MSQVELRQVVGSFIDRNVNRIRRIAWDMDILMLDGKQIATINRVPGAAIGLMAGVLLSESQREAVATAVAAARGGVRPSNIKAPVPIRGEVLDDEDTETDDSDE
jgi:hypothetical protein